MIIRENEFFQESLPSLLQGAPDTFFLIANPKLSDVYPEGELPLAMNKGTTINLLHSAENGIHIAQNALGYPGRHIYILYSQQRDFQRMVNVTHNLRQRDPEGTIVVLMCDCDQTLKRSECANSIRTKEIDYLVFTRECGGTRFFYCLIDALKKYDLPHASDTASSLP